MRIKISYPSGEGPIVEDLDVGEALLLGRDPDPAHLDPSRALPAHLRVRTVKVPSRIVSATHALIVRDGDGVRFDDLESRNGTWLELPDHGSVLAPAVDELCVELSPTATKKRGPSRPRKIEWSDADEIPEAVAAEVTRWFRSMGVPATAQVHRRNTARDERGLVSLPPIPLGDDWVLQVVEQSQARTIDPLWGETVQTLVEYVHEQGATLRAAQERAHDGHVVLASPAFREAHQRIVEAAERGLQVILLGETGAGKGTLARCYHLHSARRDKPFEAVNCAEIEKAFAHTRLFGARKGAYTGCTADIAGAIECAHGGTLLLDELAELSLDVQAMLLTFLDSRKYKRLGDDDWRTADVRIVCGTHADLRRAARDGRFRADLWYRLAGRTIEVPPLRERREDIVAFLQRTSLGERRDACSAWDALSIEARDLAVHRHDWRGNFRELEGFVRRLPEGARAGSIDLEVCRRALSEGALEPPSFVSAASTSDPWEALLARASELYRSRSGGSAPARSAEFKDYVEEVLKPLFFARALGMEHLDALPDRPSPSFEELARRLGCDGATVKAQLARFVELKRAK